MEGLYFFGGVGGIFSGGYFSGGGIFPGGWYFSGGVFFSGGIFSGGGSSPEYGQRSAGTHPTGMHSCITDMML